MQIRSTLLALSLVFSGMLHAEEWSRFRGPNGTGVSEAKNLPSKVDDSTTAWKVELGKGWSSPVIWKDRLFITAETSPTTRAVICLGAKDGKEIWRHEENFQSHRKHNFNSFASSSPFVDAERIYVNWSNGTAIQALALDHNGKVVWKNPRVADYVHEHGTGISAIVADGIMIVRSEFDTEKKGETLVTAPEQLAWKSCIVGLDAATGKQAWKLDIPNCLNTYSTPVIHDLPNGKREFVIANSGSGVVGIDTKTGKINWQHNPGYSQRSLGSPAFANGKFFCTFGSGGGGKEVASLDLTKSAPVAVPFETTKGLPYVPSPLVVGEYLYLLGDGGILKCVEWKTGKQVYEERLTSAKGGGTKFFSSPVYGDGKIYVGSQMNDVVVVKAGPKFEQISASSMDGPINASFAIAHGRVYVRTDKSLYAVGAKTPVLP
jgi:outer membrane protein assembly factor BamB